MSCRELWNDHEFLFLTLGKSFLDNELFEHQLRVLFDLEKSRLPSTIQDLENEKLRETEQQRQSLINKWVSYSEDIADLANDLASRLLKTCKCKKKAGGSVQGIIEAASLPPVDIFTGYVHDYGMSLDDARQALAVIQPNIEAKLNELMSSSKVPEEVAARVLTVRCSREKCPNYLHVGSDGFGECKACKTKQCLKCYVTTTDGVDHICDPALLQTLKTIERTSKLCPQCKERIEKISGCDQMFCTKCNTAFDWKTNQIIKGRIHNPHYFEWLTKQTTATTDIDTGNDTGVRSLDFFTPERFQSCIGRFLAKLKDTKCGSGCKLPQDFIYFSNILISLRCFWQRITHTVEEYLIDLDTEYQRDLRDLRVRFYQGVLTEAEWKSSLRELKENNDVSCRLYSARAEVVNHAFETFLKLRQRLANLPDLLSYDNILACLPAFEEAMEGAIVAAKHYNLKARYSNSIFNSVMTYPTQDMLEFGLSVRSSNTGSLVVDLSPPVFSGFNIATRMLVTVVYPECEETPYSLEYQETVLKQKEKFLVHPAFALQRKSSTVITQPLSQLESHMVIFRTHVTDCQDRFKPSESIGFDDLVYRLEELLGSEWHHEYMDVFTRCFHECRETKMSVSLLYSEHLQIFASLLTYTSSLTFWLTKTVSNAYWDANRVRLFQEIPYTMIAHHRAPKCLQALSSGWMVWLPDFSNDLCLSFEDRKNILLDIYKESSLQWIVLNKERHSADKKEKDLHYNVSKFCERLKDLTEDDLEAIGSAWRDSKTSVYKSGSRPAMFCLEPSMGYHASGTINGVTVEVPRWFAFLLEPNRKPSLFFDYDHKVYQKLCIPNSDYLTTTMKLLSAPLFTIYINGKHATYDELIYLLHLDVSWTTEVLHKMERSIESFYKLHNRGTIQPTCDMMVIHGCCSFIQLQKKRLKAIRKAQVVRLSDLVCDAVRETIVKRKELVGKHNRYITALFQ